MDSELRATDEVASLIARCASALPAGPALRRELGALRLSSDPRAQLATALFELELARVGDSEARSQVPVAAGALLNFWREGVGPELSQVHPTVHKLWEAAAALLADFDERQLELALENCWAARGEVDRLQEAIRQLPPGGGRRLEFARCLYELELARLGDEPARAEFASRTWVLLEAFHQAPVAEALVGADPGLRRLWAELRPDLDEFFEGLEEEARRRSRRASGIRQVPLLSQLKTEPALRIGVVSDPATEGEPPAALSVQEPSVSSPQPAISRPAVVLPEGDEAAVLPWSSLPSSAAAASAEAPQEPPFPMPDEEVAPRGPSTQPNINLLDLAGEPKDSRPPQDRPIPGFQTLIGLKAPEEIVDLTFETPPPAPPNPRAAPGLDDATPPGSWLPLSEAIPERRDPTPVGKTKRPQEPPLEPSGAPSAPSEVQAPSPARGAVPPPLPRAKRGPPRAPSDAARTEEVIEAIEEVEVIEEFEEAPPPPAAPAARAPSMAHHFADPELDNYVPDATTLAFWQHTLNTLSLIPDPSEARPTQRLLACETRGDRAKLNGYLDSIDGALHVPEARAFSCLIRLMLSAQLKQKGLFGQANTRRSEAFSRALALLSGDTRAAGHAAVWFSLDGPLTETALQKGLDMLWGFLTFCARRQLDPLAPSAHTTYVAEGDLS